MEGNEKIYVIDRIEGELAVCVPDSGEDTLELPVKIIPGAAEGAAIAVTSVCSEGITEIISVRPADERKSTLNDNQSRLRRLFDNNKKDS